MIKLQYFPGFPGFVRTLRLMDDDDDDDDVMMMTMM